MFLVLEELEKLTMSELQEFQELRLLIDLNKFKNQMLELNADCLTSEKLEINIFHILLNVKIQQLALFYLGVHPRMF